jgi:hypothetical protein
MQHCRVEVMVRQETSSIRWLQQRVAEACVASGEWIGKTFNDVLEEWRKRGSAKGDEPYRSNIVSITSSSKQTRERERD